jgi:hypothetical protein
MDEKRINIGLLVDVIIFDLGQPLAQKPVEPRECSAQPSYATGPGVVR